MSNVPFPFFLFGGFVVVLWVVCFSFRMRAGRRSSRAVRELAAFSEKMERRNARIAVLNRIFRDTVAGRRCLDEQTLNGYLQEYADYAANYAKDQEQWYRLLEEARNQLEGLRISQNMLGGRNDLAAIPYYTRSDKYNRLVHQYNLHRGAGFDAELVRQVRRLAPDRGRMV